MSTGLIMQTPELNESICILRYLMFSQELLQSTSACTALNLFFVTNENMPIIYTVFKTFSVDIIKSVNITSEGRNKFCLHA